MSNQRMAVVCFFWYGDRWYGGKIQLGDKVNYHQTHLDRTEKVPIELASIYVNNLYNGVRKFATQEFDFICFTNDKLMLDSGIERRPFEFLSKHGVMPRLYMFSKESGLFDRQVLALDIDIVIVGSLDDIMGYRGTFCARSKFKRGQEHKLDGDIISFSAGAENEARLWTAYKERMAWADEMTRGRERYWYRHAVDKIADRWDKITPGQVVSYKRHVMNLNKPPKNARIVSCHGEPRPHEIQSEWRQEFWRYYGK